MFFMKNKILVFVTIFALILPVIGVKAVDQKSFKIVTQSESGDYIGQGKSWDFSSVNNSKMTVRLATSSAAIFQVSSFEISYMNFEFASEEGKSIAPGLYVPAKRAAFRDSYNGIDIGGDGRGCNRILGAFYVHEYIASNGVLDRAAIDFVQICEPKSSDINEQSPKLVGSLRYNSSIPSSCDSQGCAEARKKLGLTTQANTSTNVNTQTSNTGQSATNVTSAAVQSNEFNQSIVKIRAYELSNYNGLKAVAEGSGMIISSSGIVLTNDHVISTRSQLDNSLYDAAYQVCIVKESSKKPSCDYLAKVIARNEDKDLALLQIVSYPKGSALSSFKPLKLSSSDITNINDQVIAAGFPGIGEDTITVTSGIVSGKTEKYGNQWIKTDAVVSYGSSGGAALNKAGEIIGITTQVYSDVSGELGYILSVNSINEWLNTNMSRKPEEGRLFNRLAELTRKQKILEKSNSYINIYPSFSFNKPAKWTFNHYSEEVVSVSNKSDKDSGYVIVTMLKAPYEMSIGTVKARLKRNFNESNISGLVKFTKEKDVTVDGIKAKQITLTAAKNILNVYAIPMNNYVVVFEYKYGKNDKDKKSVDEIIKSIKIKKIKPNYLESRSFKNPQPKFSLTSNNDWAMLEISNKLEPLHILNKKINEAYVSFNVEKIGEDEIGLSDDDFIFVYKDTLNLNNQETKALDYKYEITKTAKNVKLGGKINVVQVDAVEKNVSQNKIIAFDREYFVKVGAFRININLTVYSDNKDLFNKAAAEYAKLLSGLKLN